MSEETSSGEEIRMEWGDMRGISIRHADPVPLQPTKDGNVIGWVRLTLEYPIECAPEYLEMTHDSDMGDVTHGTWHRSMGTWCGDNITDELEAALELVRTSTVYTTINSAMNGGCLCEFVVNHDAFVNAEKSTPGGPTREELLAVVADLAKITAVELEVAGQGPMQLGCKFCRGDDWGHPFTHKPTCLWQRAGALLAREVAR